MNYRQKKLIRLLDNDAKTVSYFAKELSISKRTIHNDLNVIEPFLLERGYELVKKPGVGIYIIPRADKVVNLSERKVLLSIPERQLAIFEDLLFRKRKVSLETLSEEYYVSVSSIRNDLSQIESNFLNSDTLKLVRDIDGTYLRGDEEATLRTHIKFCQHIYLNSEQQFSSDGFYKIFRRLYTCEIVDACLEAIEDVEHKNITFMGDYYRTSLLIILIVLTYRVKTLSHSDDFVSVLSKTTDYSDTSEFSKSMLNNISNKLGISFIKDDCIFLNVHIKGLRMSVDESDENRKFEPTVKKILDNISANIGIDISSHNKVEQQLIVHINSMLYRVNNDIAIKNLLTKEIKKEYMPLFNSLWVVLNQELKEYINGKTISEDEVAFIVIYLQTILSIESKNKRVLIICPNGISTSQLLLNKLRSILPPVDLIDAKSIAEAEEMDLSLFDFIITTTDHNLENDNVVRISPLLTNHDIGKITSYFNQKILIEDQEKVNYFPTMLKSIDVDAIFIEKKREGKSKEDILRIIHNRLVDLDYVEEEYYDSILERESLGSTEVGNYAAVPHGSPKYVKKSILAIYIFEENFKWDENQIKIVMLPCIVQKDIVELRELFSEILGFLGNTVLFNKVVESSNKEEMVNILKGVKI